MFLDESGLSQRPHRCRTWSPKGQTPVLQYSFNWKKLLAMAGITWWNFYFQLHGGSIRSPQVMEFLRHLERNIKKKLLVIWDRSRPIVAVWFNSLSPVGRARSVWSTCRLTSPNSTLWNTSGGIGNTMSFPTSVRRPSLNLATMPSGLSNVCVVVPSASKLSGSKRNCFKTSNYRHYIL